MFEAWIRMQLLLSCVKSNPSQLFLGRMTLDDVKGNTLKENV